MRTIKEIFADNLRRYRGDRSQAAIAELAGIPFRTYQHAEQGHIPQVSNIQAIASAFQISESALFADEFVVLDALPARTRFLIFASELPEDIAKKYLKTYELFEKLTEQEQKHILQSCEHFISIRSQKAQGSKRVSN